MSAGIVRIRIVVLPVMSLVASRGSEALRPDVQRVLKTNLRAALGKRNAEAAAAKPASQTRRSAV
jgi:hypothetical protein